MKKLITVAIILFVITLLSCGGASTDNSNNNVSASGQTASQTSSAATDGNASFSCILDGKEISGKGTDQNINAAFHLTGDDKGQIVFRLSDINNMQDRFMFQVPAKTGSTTFSVSTGYSYAGYTSPDLATYLDNPVTVTITSITSSRVSGTFSGKYTLSEGSGNSNSKQTIEVTDGKFDIPFSTSADWKKLYHAE